MAVDGRHTDDMDWLNMDWLEETPQPEVQPRRQPSRQDAAPARPRQQRQEPINWQEETPQPRRQPSRPQQTQRPAQPRQDTASRPRTAQSQPPQRQQQAQRPRQDTMSRQDAPARPRQPQRQQQTQRSAAYAPRQQRPAQPYREPYPSRQQPARRERYVEVEPDDYRPKRRLVSKRNIPLILLVVILVGGIGFAGFKLGSALLNYQRDRSAYNDLADAALSGLAEPNATKRPDEPVEPDVQQQPQSEAPFAVNWDYLRSTNSDVVGWIYCAGTKINYPVVQTGDNDYYLHRDFTTRQPNTSGTLFADYNSALGVTYSNFIIYGHNMKDGSMFAAVEDYVSQAFYDEHPVMYFLTPNQNYRIELISGRIVEASTNNYPIYFSGDGDYSNYIGQITSSSFFGTRASVSTAYQLISLSTCDYSNSYSNPRFLLQGQLIPIT